MTAFILLNRRQQNNLNRPNYSLEDDVLRIILFKKAARNTSRHEDCQGRNDNWLKYILEAFQDHWVCRLQSSCSYKPN